MSAEAAGYAARYTLKKINGDLAEEHYGGRAAEFNLCSQGLGKGWIEKYWKDVFRHDHVVYKGKECPVPRYYTRWLQTQYPEIFEKLAEKRKDYYDNLTYESGKRLYQAAQARDQKTKTLVRTYEEVGAERATAADRSKPNRPFDG
jgi:hypothetical protein